MDQQILKVDTATYADIRQAWMETKSDGLRTSGSIVADYYGITEPEVIASGCGHFAKRLCGDWRELLIGLRALGPLRLQVRNEMISHEMLGLLDPMSALDKRLYFLAGDNSLSLETNRLQVGFLVQEPESGHYNAIYFFDLDGSPVLIIRIPEELRGQSQPLFARFIHPSQAKDQPVVHVGHRGGEPGWPLKEVEQLRQGWSNLMNGEGIQQFLEKNGISYLQLLKMLGDPLARPLPKGSLRILLEVRMDHILPFRIVSHSTGAVMNWYGEVTDIVVHDSVLQVKGIGMNLWYDEDTVDQGWLVTLPGADTPSRAEFFDAHGEHLVTLTVPHKAKKHFDLGWQDIVEILVTLELC
jgi:putative heme degradation protein